MLAEQLLSDWPPSRWSDRRLLLGVSGGADSVALLLALHKFAASGRLIVAHMNHGWRGLESDEDAKFVTQLCHQLGRPCIMRVLQNRDTEHVNQIDSIGGSKLAMLAKANMESSDTPIELSNLTEIENKSDALIKTEETARRARYDFFQQAAYETGASYVVTAHTADDRVETLLHNLLRGGGIAGAASLVMFRSFADELVLVRPLLRKRRSEIESFLSHVGQDFRTDSSNLQLHFRRNFLRRQVLPLLAEHYPAATSSLLNFSELAEELLQDVQTLADQWLAQVDRLTAEAGVALTAARGRWPGPRYFVSPLTAWEGTPWTVIQAALRTVWLGQDWPMGAMSRVHWNAVRELSRQRSGVLNLPANLRAEAWRGFLAIGPLTAS